MTRYNKGANAERELLQLLHHAGLAVCRAAGSGRGKQDIPTPDAVALSRGKIYAFECKAWRASSLHISHAQMGELEEWCALAGAELVIAWKIPQRGWRFMEKGHFRKIDKSYALTRKKAFEVGKKVDHFAVLR